MLTRSSIENDKAGIGIPEDEFSFKEGGQRSKSSMKRCCLSKDLKELGDEPCTSRRRS